MSFQIVYSENANQERHEVDIGSYGYPMISVKNTQNEKIYTVVVLTNSMHKKINMIVDGTIHDYANSSRFYFDKLYYVKKPHMLVHRDVLGLYNNPSEFSVDHINRIPCDNRKDNLRLATWTQQSFNKGIRRDRQDHNDKCPEAIFDLPRFIRWESKEEKYTFKDHPLSKAAQKMDINLNVSGCKSSRASLEDKLRDCLEKLINAFDLMYSLGHRLDQDNIEDFRLNLGREYNEIVRLVHHYNPDVFPDTTIDINNLITYSNQKEYYQAFIDALPPPQDNYYGPRHISSHLVEVPDKNAYAMFKSDEAFIWDSKYHDILKDFCIDHSDNRFVLTPKMCAQFQIPYAKTAKASMRMYLADFVYHILEKNEKKDDHVVVNINQISTDVRVKNLVYVKGIPKNFRAVTCFPIVKVDIGMPYLPRGVTTIEATRKDAKKRSFEFHVRQPSSFLRFDGSVPPPYTENKPKKITFNMDNAKQILESKVLPLLREVNPNFDQDNQMYQELIKDFYDMKALRP